MNPAYPRVAQRAGHRCEYCHAPEVMFNVAFEVEHITPRSRGGSNQDNNYALACRSCNLHKSDSPVHDETTDAEVDLFNPRADSWGEHFQVDAGGHITGRSATGRVTVRQLRMNSHLQLAARKHWIQLGLFP